MDAWFMYKLVWVSGTNHPNKYAPAQRTKNEFVHNFFVCNIVRVRVRVREQTLNKKKVGSK